MKDPKRGGDDPDYVSYQYPSMSNEFLDPNEFVSMTKDLPELMYRQEILADFIESGGEVFRNLNRVLAPCLKEPIPEHNYVGGGDLGKYQDFTVLFIADLDTNELVYYERFNKLDWDYQKCVLPQPSKIQRRRNVYRLYWSWRPYRLRISSGKEPM